MPEDLQTARLRPGERFWPSDSVSTAHLHSEDVARASRGRPSPRVTIRRWMAFIGRSRAHRLRNLFRPESSASPEMEAQSAVPPRRTGSRPAPPTPALPSGGRLFRECSAKGGPQGGFGASLRSDQSECESQTDRKASLLMCTFHRRYFLGAQKRRPSALWSGCWPKRRSAVLRRQIWVFFGQSLSANCGKYGNEETLFRRLEFPTFVSAFFIRRYNSWADVWPNNPQNLKTSSLTLRKTLRKRGLRGRMRETDLFLVNRPDERVLGARKRKTRHRWPKTNFSTNRQCSHRSDSQSTRRASERGSKVRVCCPICRRSKRPIRTRRSKTSLAGTHHVTTLQRLDSVRASRRRTTCGARPGTAHEPFPWVARRRCSTPDARLRKCCTSWTKRASVTSRLCWDQSSSMCFSTDLRRSAWRLDLRMRIGLYRERPSSVTTTSESSVTWQNKRPLSPASRASAIRWHWHWRSSRWRTSTWPLSETRLAKLMTDPEVEVGVNSVIGRLVRRLFIQGQEVDREELTVGERAVDKGDNELPPPTAKEFRTESWGSSAREVVASVASENVLLLYW